MLPMPNRRMEEWRFASISGVSFDGFSLPGKLSEETAREIDARSRRFAGVAGKLVFADDHPVVAELAPELAAQGVILAPLKQKRYLSIFQNLGVGVDLERYLLIILAKH